MQSRIRIVNSCFDKRARELYVCMGFWPLGAATRLERGDDSSNLKAASANIACSIYIWWSLSSPKHIALHVRITTAHAALDHNDDGRNGRLVWS